MELNRTQMNPKDIGKTEILKVFDLNEGLVGKEVVVRGRIHTTRATGKKCFLVIRDRLSTV